ncbi:response regulator [Ideonella sp. A 288]|uniref:response regulator n=1 Tax=Ideonella sp. A 288 TaxID=1962181 RepID=UPI000B4AE46F|nr:response regulator [Ideonella sp. A 288]
MAAPRVLVVDDNRLNAELVDFVLTADGLQVTHALDADQALARLAEGAPDLVLMDIQLPGMDGLALTRLIKADPALRHIAVVAFTAYAMKGDEAVMRQAGCDGYLSKPIDVARFASQVRALLPQAGPA